MEARHITPDDAPLDPGAPALPRFTSAPHNNASQSASRENVWMANAFVIALVAVFVTTLLVGIVLRVRRWIRWRRMQRYLHQHLEDGGDVDFVEDEEDKEGEDEEG
ncbi:hypothetical protein EV356DRAFT_185724 [Viridothelium virens]|uniref:Uncharacterized protein n=1 Tax=Viridothelium virens TaxID=1048519 RepID=A0A6A6H7A8_VIRVR|nr:hypothetical protein EV356DRAFT_185724 [Viridothelium virens]